MLTPSAFAVDAVTLHLGRISGLGWSIESLDLEFNWQQESIASYQIRAKEVTHSAFSPPLKDLLITCQQGTVSDYVVSCQKGTLHLQHPLLDDPQVAMTFNWNRQQQQIDVQLSALHLASGVVKGSFHADATEWNLKIDVDAVDMAVVKAHLATYLMMTFDVELTGGVDLVASVAGAADLPSRLQWQAAFHEAAFSDASGEHLGEALSGIWQGGFVLEKSEWKGEMALALHQGELLTPYVYVGVGQQPISISAKLNIGQQQLQLNALRYDHPGILTFTSSATLLRQQPLVLDTFQLQAEPFSIQKVYQQYLLPTLAAPMFTNLELSGDAKLDLAYKADVEQSLTLKLDDVHVEEKRAALGDEMEGEGAGQQRGAFGLYGVNGILNWTSGQKPVASLLSWDSGYLMEEITLGGTSLNLVLQEKNVTLLNHAAIPVLDGSLAISTFDLTLDDEPRFMFGGALTPISMEAFSQAMGWVPLSGKLSGGIPKATYQNGVLTVDGAMMANIFKGQAIVRDLRVEDMFGVWPILHANFELKDLDLEALTHTFSFGKITGKLEGRIDNLYLENWRPVSFDAHFATPEQDESRHRISQRAIDNISNLGGSGMSGALSRSFLSFFEEFGYARLGVSCRLENGVCEMGGVEAAAQGSYLVKGSGLPRIDIVGYNHQVDWELLIGKLTEIAETGVGNAAIE